MPYLTNYHLREQEAYALLGPVRATLRELEQRVAHYTARLTLEPGQQEALRAAHRALTAASQEVERIWRASDPGAAPPAATRPEAGA